MIDIARNIVPCSDKQDMKSRNGSYFQPSFSTRKRQRISSDLFSELPQKRSKTTNGRIWNKATYSFSSQILCTISSKVIRMWASFTIFVRLLQKLRMEKYDLITILGPTASGKTPLAAALAYKLDTEIISGDSRQVYRRMDLGTGKDLEDYVVNGQQIPYHLIDIVDPGYKYNVFEFQRDFLNAYDQVRWKDKLPILCGGTGMYLESVLKGYRLLPVPENPKLRDSLADKSLAELTRLLSTYRKLHNSTDVDTVKRAIRAIEIEEYYKHQSAEYREFPQIHSLIIGVDIARELRREKISHRLKQRLDEGMVNEVKALLDSGISSEDLIYYGLEYKYLTLYVLGKLSFNEMFHQLEIAIHQFAKRQMTWFRGMERRGFTIHWLDACLPMEDKVEKIINLLHTKN